MGTEYKDYGNDDDSDDGANGYIYNDADYEGYLFHYKDMVCFIQDLTNLSRVSICKSMTCITL